MRAGIPIAVLQAAAMQAVLAAPQYRAADSAMSNTRGNVSPPQDGSLYAEEGEPVTTPIQPASQDEVQTQPQVGSGGGGSNAGALAGIGGGLLATGGSLATGILGAGGAGAAGGLGAGTGAGAAGGDIASGLRPTWEGDVSNTPPAQTADEGIYVDEFGNEHPIPQTGEEKTFSMNVQGEGEGALSESGRGAAGPSQPQGINLQHFSQSDQSIANSYLKTPGSAHVKPFSGGRTPAERKLFQNVRNNYSNLKEVKATSNNVGNYAAGNRGRYRYIAGTDSKGQEMLIGVAEHGTTNNNFVNWTPFPKPRPVV
ncbi:hypothetical protein ETB97_009473 [Aspergillus alliaceus]|uniref:Uncharacterized protein n=1 Tax=Petromyces alliaceus TaxID=209559 RepID=A0A8H6E0Y6_PETAA|nr:hypothetical protein ETB97_009473 [Aspergillus burnettii]